MKRLSCTLLFAAIGLILTAQPKLTETNIDQIIDNMTLQEKAGLLVGARQTSLVPGAAGATRPIERLGIPATILADGPAGLRISSTRGNDGQTYYCTGFPVGTVLACTWNTELVESLTQAMGQEVKEYGVDVLLAPGMNLHRNPLCGRNFEYFSEDPLLSGRIGAAYIRGIQSNGVGVSVKHFAGNNQETNRSNNDAVISARALRELYLKNFEISVRQAKPWTIMSSYNKINGHFTQQSHDLLTTILRDEWGYKGIVMTDWGNKAGTVDAVKAGNDLMEPGADSEIQRIVAGVEDGTLSIDEVNRNVRNMLEYIIRTPRFKGYTYSNKPDLQAHGELVRSAAAEGMVLLRNENGTLPLASQRRIALFGLNAYKSIAGGTGSGNVNKAYIRNVDEGLREAGFTLDERIADFYAKYRSYAASLAAMNGERSRDILFGEAVLQEVPVSMSAVQASVGRNDVAVIVIGRNAGEGADRTMDDDFNLTTAERQLISDVSTIYHQAGKKVIVVLNIGGVIETASWKNQTDAILLAWTPGQEVGFSVADVLVGKLNPSGKLAMTFPMNYLDIPSSFHFPYNGNTAAPNTTGQRRPNAAEPSARANVDYTEYAEGIWVGYRYFNTARKEVSYPFGYGLSYTTFAYSKPVVRASGDGFTASITVTNTGKTAGKETVQVYVSAPAGGMVKPAAELKAFAKTKLLEPGESQTLHFTVDAYTLASFNEKNSRWETAAGTYTVSFAAHIEEVKARGTFNGKARNWPVHSVLLPERELAEITVR